MKQRDNCTGSGKHAHPIDRTMPKATGIPRSAYKKPRKPSTGRMFNRAWPPLTPPSPLIRHHSALDLVYLVYLVCLVNPRNPKNGQSRQSSAIPPISSRVIFHVLRFTSPERQMISLGENGILYREHVRHNRRAILQDAQKDRPARPQRAKRRGVRFGTLSL